MLYRLINYPAVSFNSDKFNDYTILYYTLSLLFKFICIEFDSWKVRRLNLALDNWFWLYIIDHSHEYHNAPLYTHGLHKCIIFNSIQFYSLFWAFSFFNRILKNDQCIVVFMQVVYCFQYFHIIPILNFLRKRLPASYIPNLYENVDACVFNVLKYNINPLHLKISQNLARQDLSISLCLHLAKKGRCEGKRY